MWIIKFVEKANFMIFFSTLKKSKKENNFKEIEK